MGKIIPYLIIGVVLLIIIGLTIKNWDKIKGLFGKGGIKECDGLAPFECIKKLGAEKTISATAGDRYDYKNYGFYSNNRVGFIGSSPAKKGNYDTKQIIWDDGSKITLKQIFNL